MKTANGRSSTTADGLAHRAVLSLALDKRTGDVWAGTMGGLSRISAGRIDTFTQLNSGLSNDVVYGVGVQGDYVWVATAAGASRLNTRTGQWSLFNERNTPMYEIWTYAVSPARRQGVLRGVGRRRARVRRQKTRALERLQRSRRRNRNGVVQGPGPDPRDHHIGQLRRQDRLGGDLLRRQPLRRPLLAQLSDQGQRAAQQLHEPGQRRSTPTAHGSRTDKGLAYYDGANWAVYRPALDTQQAGDAGARCGGQRHAALPSTPRPAHNYVLGVDFQGDDIWVATAKGLSHGIRQINEQLKETIIMMHVQEILASNRRTRRSRSARSPTSAC